MLMSLQRLRLKSRLSRAAVETLTIVAYRQPISRPEIEQLRGVGSDSVVTHLLERRLVRIVGRKATPGRPVLYGTTREFLEHFGLRDLDELPPFEPPVDAAGEGPAKAAVDASETADVTAEPVDSLDATDAHDAERELGEGGARELVPGLTAMPPVRLHKLLAEAGVASRRAAERLIVEGRVRVNGVPVVELGAHADPVTDRIEVDGRPLPQGRAEALRAPPQAARVPHHARRSARPAARVRPGARARACGSIPWGGSTTTPRVSSS